MRRFKSRSVTAMNTSPDPVTFLKVNELQKVTIENVGTNELKAILATAVEAVNFKAKELCKNANLKPKGRKATPASKKSKPWPPAKSAPSSRGRSNPSSAPKSN